MRHPFYFCHAFVMSFCCSISVILATLGVVLLVTWMSLWEMLAIRAFSDESGGATDENSFEIAPEDG